MPWWEKKEPQAYSEWQALKTPEGLDYYYNTVSGATVWDKPTELMTDDEMKNQGEWVWIPDPEQCYIPGTVQSRGGGGISVRTQNGQMFDLPAHTQLMPLKPASLKRVVQDLVLLDDMSTPLILHNLKARFEGQKIYTNVGTIVISINPYQDLGLYTPEKIYEYQHRGVKEMPPHVFNTAHNAYKGLKDFGNKQAIIISGESGAGKTEATKQCLSYIAAVAGSVGNVEQKVLKANPILEAFGNAKTVRNDNSSRFGKYMELFFSRGDFKICGSMTTNYLLEKIRVVQQAPTERNFHAFYQLVKAGTAQMKQQFQVGSRCEDYYYLNQSGCIDVSTINDQREFNDVVDAFRELEFNQQDQDHIWGMTSAILALGNVYFGEGGTASVGDKAWADVAAGQLQVNVDIVVKALCIRTLKIRGSSDTKVPLDPKTAGDNRHALAKFLYAKMFDWIVVKINKSMNKPSGQLNTIGILDIFGFEIFEQNSFEQLCINFTNEMLQQHFNNNTFKLEEKLYQSENINFQHVDFIDNQPVLDMIQQRGTGILPLLDEELVMPKGSDQTFLMKMHQAHARTKTYGKVLKNPDHFIVRHYAGEVTYDAIGFLEKNRDTLTQDLLTMLGTSRSPFVKVLFPTTVLSTKDKKSSLSKQFQKQLLELMRQLNQTEPHYIRCVKPNDQKSASTFTPRNCLEQLTYSGVFEAVCIRKQGFPFRLKHDVFVKHYGCIMPDPNKRYASSLQGCKEIVHHMNLDQTNVRTGTTMMLYRADEHKALELQRSIKVVAIEMEENLARLCKTNVNGFNTQQKEKFFEELSRACEKADEFRLTSPMANKARDMLEMYIESRIDDETKNGLQQAYDQCNKANLEYYIGVCEQNGYRTKMYKECVRLLARINRILEETQNACYNLEEHHVDACIQAGDEVKLYDEWLDYLRALKNGPTIDYLTAQYQKAVENKNDDRAIRLDIRRKDELYTSSANSYALTSFSKLKQPADWAGEKFMGKKDLLTAGFLAWQPKKIHSSVCQYNEPDKKRMKEIKKRAIDCHSYIMKYMGQRVAKSETSVARGRQAVHEGLAHPEIRDEVFVLLIKQLTNNPDPGATKMGWDMMALCLLTFPPSKDMEDFLECYLRKCAPSGKSTDQYKGWLRQRVYHGPVTTPPTEPELEQIEQTLTSRSRGFSEPLPPGAPPYQDLFDSFYDQRPVQNTFRRSMAHAQPARGGGGPPKPKMEPTAEKTPWQEVKDDNGDIYYWNEETGESSWDKPAALQFANVATAVRGY